MKRGSVWTAGALAGTRCFNRQTVCRLNHAGGGAGGPDCLRLVVQELFA
jgi:hypothetical protein